MATTFTFFKKLNTLGALALSAMGFSLPFAAFAATDTLSWRPSVLSINIGNILIAFFNIFWPIVVTIILIAFLYAGFLFLSAQGDPTKTAEARKVVIWAIVGVIIIVLSGTLIAFISSFFPAAPGPCGVDQFGNCSGTCGGTQICSATPGLGYRECACYDTAP